LNQTYGKGVFEGMTQITHLTVLDSKILRTHTYPLWGMTGVRTLTIGNMVTQIGRNAFGNSELSYARLENDESWSCTQDPEPCDPHNCKSRKYPSEHCADAGMPYVTSLTLPDSVTEIDSGAFNGLSGVTNLTIGSKVVITSVGPECTVGRTCSTPFSGLRSFAQLWHREPFWPTGDEYGGGEVCVTLSLQNGDKRVFDYQNELNQTSNLRLRPWALEHQPGGMLKYDAAKKYLLKMTSGDYLRPGLTVVTQSELDTLRTYPEYNICQTDPTGRCSGSGPRSAADCLPTPPPAPATTTGGSDDHSIDTCIHTCDDLKDYCIGAIETLVYTNCYDMMKEFFAAPFLTEQQLDDAARNFYTTETEAEGSTWRRPVASDYDCHLACTNEPEPHDDDEPDQRDDRRARAHN